MSHLSKNLARVDAGTCVACGCCLKVCPRQALSVFKVPTQWSIRTPVWDAASAQRNVRPA